jgi:hypothetical protein
MVFRRIWVGWLGLAAGFFGVSTGPGLAQQRGYAEGPALGENRAGPEEAFTLRTALFGHRSAESQSAAAGLPLGELSPQMQAQVQRVVTKPTLFTHGPAETFTCCPGIYRWLLEHPDQAVQLWRRLGARCMDIEDRGKGVFGWSDGQGSDVRWWTAYRSPQMRMWYAEGNVRAAGILPLVPVRALVVLRHSEARMASGRTFIRHQLDLFMQTDSKTAALVTRLMGPSAPRMAEQAAGQMEMFFSALAWYLDQHPGKARTVLQGILPAAAPEWQELQEAPKLAPAEPLPPAAGP